MVAPCTLTGDSIAVGLYPHMPCHMAYAKVGANTKTIDSYAGPAVGTVIISAGSNDSNPTVSLYQKLREKYAGRPVIWVLPAPKFENARNAIKTVASSWGDTIMYLQDIGRDQVHPTGSGYIRNAQVLKTAPSIPDANVREAQ